MTARRGPRSRRLLAAVLLTLALVLSATVVLVRLQGGAPVAAAGPSTGTTPSTRTTPATGTTATPRRSTATPSPTGPLQLVGFGDSVMAGAGCDCDDFLQQTADRLRQRTGRAVDTDNNAANGETAADLLGDLRTDRSLTEQIGTADVIVLTIGANDLGPALDNWVGDACERSCYHPQVAAMGDRLSDILAIVDQEKKTGAAVYVLDYWNVFEDGDVGAGDYDEGYLAWSDQVTRDANAAICRAADLADATCVDLYAPFKGDDGSNDPTRLLADDGDHPNGAGTTLIASVLVATIEQRGTPG